MQICLESHLQMKKKTHRLHIAESCFNTNILLSRHYGFDISCTNLSRIHFIRANGIAPILTDCIVGPAIDSRLDSDKAILGTAQDANIMFTSNHFCKRNRPLE